MATYIKLTDCKNSNEKKQGFFKSENRHEARQEDFEKIPGSPVAYWVSDKFVNSFLTSNKIIDYADITGSHNKTADNEKFLRRVWEIDASKKFTKWFRYAKGGEFKKWYGNLEYIVDWSDSSRSFYSKNQTSNLINQKYWFKFGITYTDLTSKGFNCRLIDNLSISDMSGPAIYIDEKSTRNFLMSLLNSKFANDVFTLLNPTFHIKINDIKKLPIIFPKQETTKQVIETLTQECIDISKQEWDSRETSWDFKTNELIKHKKDSKLETAFFSYCDYWREKFFTLHQNEEELNRLFIEIYELEDELTLEVELGDITILKNEAKIVDGKLVFQADEIMKQFVSYGVGVMFGRYSLDNDGLVVANMGQEIPTDTTFEIDDDNIIPILEDDYFKDDITSRFVQFVKVTFGEQHLQENIRFIENSLGITLRKYFVQKFYDDHIKRYKKRPIYWMISSPKKGFMSLIYMHRYKSDLFARVRNSYLSEYIAKLEAHKETFHLTTTSETASDKDKKDANKRIKDIETKLKELIAFDRNTMMRFSQNGTDIDLDDGVKVNYCKFEDIFYPIAGLCK